MRHRDLKGLLATSRSISWLHRTPSPTADLDGFLEGIATALRSSSYEAVLPPVTPRHSHSRRAVIACPSRSPIPPTRRCLAPSTSWS